MSRSTFLVVSAVLALGLSGCGDDLRPMTATWTGINREWLAKRDALKTDAALQSRQLGVLAATPGLDPNNPAAKALLAAELTEQAQTEEFITLSVALDQQRARVAQSFKSRKLPLVTAAIAEAQAEAGAVFSKLSGLQLQQGAQLKTLETAVSEELAAAKVAATMAFEESQRWAAASVERQPLQLTRIRFTEGTAALEAAEAGPQKELERLAVWAGACSGLTFSVTGHYSKELAPKAALELTKHRAQAVKSWLIAHQVPPSQIVDASGAGATHPLVDEPEPGSEAAQAMNPDELEALRDQNRRISVEAVRLCPAG